MRRLSVLGVVLTFFVHSKSLSAAQIPFAQRDVAPEYSEAYLSVPLNWFGGTNGHRNRQIRIRYRVIGGDRRERPWLFVIGGGPGSSSLSSYFSRAGFDEAQRGFLKHFRVVVFDQRGTGESSPLELAPESIDPEPNLRYFSTPSHARDLGALIRHLTQPQENVYLLGHSYGGLVVSRYLVDTQSGPRPKGVVYAMAPLRVEDAYDFVKARTLEQIAASSQMPEKLKALIRPSDIVWPKRLWRMDRARNSVPPMSIC